MNRFCCGCALVVLMSCDAVSLAIDKAITPDVSQIKDGRQWHVINADCDTEMEDGKNVVRLRPKGGNKSGGSNVGLALVEGLEFSEGTLEIDLKGKGKSERTFLGVAFGVADGKTFEAIYFRPFNFMANANPYRQRAVQYVCWPENTWERLRMDKPGKFESAVKPVPDPSGWFHARVEVTKKKVSVWVGDAKEHCLVVERLSGRERGKVGLWVDSNEGAFRNLKILLAQ
jgi:Domain of Unknown Function (DUF1080)